MKNTFYILRSNLNFALSTTSYDINTGEEQVVSGIYGFPMLTYGIDKRRINTHPVFMLASGILFSSAYIICYDTNNNFIESKQIVNPRKAYYLHEKTSRVALTIETSVENIARTWFYVGTAVEPHYKKLEKKYSKETNQMFFREGLEGKITIFGDDYKYVNSSSLEQDLAFIICRDDEIISRNVFNKSDCKIDHAKKSIDLKLQPEDLYTNILNNYSNEYDIIKLAPPITKLTLTKRMAYQIYISGANNITTVANGTYWEDDVNEPIYDINKLEKKYHFARVGETKREILIETESVPVINGSYIMEANSPIWDSVLNGSQIRFIKEYETGSSTFPEYAAKMSSSQRISVDSNITIDGRLSVDLYSINIFSPSNILIYKSQDVYYKDMGTFMIGSNMEDTSDSEFFFTHFKMIAQEQSFAILPQPIEFNMDECFIEYGTCARIICDVDSVTIEGENYVMYDIPADDFVYNRGNYNKCIGIVGLSIHQTAATSQQPTRYGIDDYGRYFSSNFLGQESLSRGKPIPISRSSWANSSIWATFGNAWSSFESLFRKEFKLKNAYDISDVISSILKQIDPLIIHEGTSDYSEFLYSDISPLDDDEQRNGCRLYISPKSNILKGNYDQAAQKAELSLEQLMDMLRDCYRCYWFIDSQNRFRIEHISYFLDGMHYSIGITDDELTNKIVLGCNFADIDIRIIRFTIGSANNLYISLRDSSDMQEVTAKYYSSLENIPYSLTLVTDKGDNTLTINTPLLLDLISSNYGKSNYYIKGTINITDNEDADDLIAGCILYDKSIKILRFTIGSANNLYISLRDSSDVQEITAKYYASLESIQDSITFMSSGVVKCVLNLNIERLRDLISSNYRKSNYYIKGNFVGMYKYAGPFDLNDKRDKFNRKEALYCQQEVEFDKTELFSRYEFNWMDDCTDIFGNNYIDIISKYIKHDEKNEISVAKFSSDIDFMLLAPDRFSMDGFGLLVANYTNKKVPIIQNSYFYDGEYNYPYSAASQNYLASWLYLIRYYLYDMPANTIKYSGFLDDNVMQVKGLKKSLVHDIEIPMLLSDIDIVKLIHTELGFGVIDSILYNIDTNHAKFRLRYEP